MDPLPEYGSHAFIPYQKSTKSDPTSPSPSSSTSSLDDLEPIKLLNTSTWTYCGPLLSPAADALPTSFHTWSNSTISGSLLPRLLPLLSFLHTFLTSAKIHNFWLTIRATKSTPAYDTPRWHTDDIFFDHPGTSSRLSPAPSPSLNPTRYWKLAATLLGPPTLFLPLPINPSALTSLRTTRKHALSARPHPCFSPRCTTCLDALDAARHVLATSFSSLPTVSPPPGSLAFFRLGDAEGAVHSEPACAEDRVFVNVVPGSEEELRGLMGRWGMGFPRSWSFGVPVGFEGDGEVESGGMDVRGRDIRGDEGRTSTMSVNLGSGYGEWLERRGVSFAEVFGVGGKGG